MAKSMADVLREEGIEEGETRGETRAKRESIIKLLQIKFDSVPESVSKKINATRSLSKLNTLFEKAATINTLDDFDE